MPDEYFYRTFHSYSSGENSRSGFRAGQPTPLQRRNYQTVRRSLEKHFDMDNTSPTPWISTTGDLLRAITIAINMYAQGMEGVSIAVINPDKCDLESAEDLSEQYHLGDVDPILRRTEFLCQGRINRNAVVACSSFEQLVNRGLFDLVPEFDRTDSYWNEIDDEADIPLDVMRDAVQNTPAETGGNGYWTNVGARAAELVSLFPRGAHRRPMADEVVDWWVDEDGCSSRQCGYITRGINNILRS